MFHIQQQHTGSIGVVAGVDACENIVYIIFWQHDLCDLCKILRLIFPNPKNLRRGKTGKGNIGRPGRQLLLADGIIQVVHLFGGSSIVPKDGRTNYLIIFI